jgi:maleate isomerase
MATTSATATPAARTRTRGAPGSRIRARIGYSAVAFVTELLPKYFYEIVPDGVLMSLLTLQIAEHTERNFEDLHAQGLRAAESFARAGADVIIMGGAPTNIAHGEGALAREIAELATRLGVPVSSSSIAQGNALKALGARKVGTINPAVPRKIGDSASGSLGDGMELVGRKHVGAKLEDYNRIPPERGLELGRELMREHPEIDTLIYGCPHWASIESIEPLEQEFGINVVTALQAIIWEGLRLAGVNDKVEGYGKLFREH